MQIKSLINQFIILCKVVFIYCKNYIKFLSGLSFFPYILTRILFFHLLYHLFFPFGLLCSTIYKSAIFYHEKSQISQLEKKIELLSQEIKIIKSGTAQEKELIALKYRRGTISQHNLIHNKQKN